jgi:NitT/TauT family transport system substrate-binding protein
MFNRRIILKKIGSTGILISTCSMSNSAWSQSNKIKVGFTASADAAASFVAQEEGFFKKRGLEVELILIAINSTIPGALASSSIDIGNPSPSVFLGAIDGGIDLLAIGTTSVVSKNVVAFGAVVRTGVNIQQPKDFVGKRIGVPGLNAFLHVLFKKWLADKNVDSKLVTFIEVPFPSMPDVIRGGSLDGVITAEPVMSRIVSAGTGSIFTYMASDLTEELPTAFWASSRNWATKNSDIVRRFRESTEEAVSFVKTNSVGAQLHISKYTRIPIEIIRSVPMPVLRNEVTDRDLINWSKIMTDQGMLRNQLDVSKLRFK